MIINDISDHLPVFCTIKGNDVNRTKINQYVYSKRTINEESIIKFTDSLNGARWGTKLTQTLTQVTMLLVVYLQGCTSNVFQLVLER